MGNTDFSSKNRLYRFFNDFSLYIMMLPGVICLFIFCYIPMYGLIIAFKNFQPRKGFLGSQFVGLKWFKYIFFESPDFGQVFTNTIIIALFKISLGTLASLLFALLLNELRNKYVKRFIQTATYLPNFLSWVIIGGVFIDLLSQDGIINKLINSFGLKSIFFLGSNHWFKTVIIATDVWKTFGFGAILYIAAIAGINQELYEACIIDGGNRFKQMLHITLPGVVPVVIMMVTLSLGSILSANGSQEQVLVLYNPAVYQSGDIIDTFTFRTGIQNVQYSFATAIGLFKSVIGFILIIIANKISIRFASRRIF
jgi:putative aldouronate transport system permease protein